MPADEQTRSFSEDSTPKSGMCAWCGKNAEVHLSLLGEIAAHPGGSFCLACGEAVIHNLQKVRTSYAPAEQVATLFSSFTHPDPAYKPSLSSDPLPEEIEGGTIFWEGQGWSSDGPFAGA